MTKQADLDAFVEIMAQHRDAYTDLGAEALAKGLDEMGLRWIDCAESVQALINEALRTYGPVDTRN